MSTGIHKELYYSYNSSDSLGPLFACIQRSVLSGICFYLLSLLCNGFCVVFCQHLRSDPTSVQALIKTNTNYYLSRTLRPACSQGPLLSCLLLSTACCQLLVSEWCPDFGGVVAIPVVAILDSVIAFKPFESIKYHHKSQAQSQVSTPGCCPLPLLLCPLSCGLVVSCL